MKLVVDKNKNEEGKWVEYEEGVKLKVRPLYASTTRKIRSKCVSVKNTRRGREEILNDDKFEEEMADYLLEDWEGVVDESGNELECTRENKIALLDIQDVASFVFNTAREAELNADAEVKNS